MHYVSTRDASLKYTAAHAIEQGLSREGGLFLPERLPELPSLETLVPMSYQERAVAIMKLFLDEFSVEELQEYAAKAYGPEKFDCAAVAPVKELHCKTSVLELWHGPTCAFKDMALQMLPYLLTASMKKNGEDKTVCILVATSGDTGKAALEGFCDVDHTKILVFYPKDGVSDIQQLQMVTQSGENVGVCAVYGNFDDAQTGVKQLFSNSELEQTLSQRGYLLSSANSINWGRVLPQLVYYVSAYCDLLKSGSIEEGQQINVCVPTGNFGNILAAYYAKIMGVPINKLICASNSNDVLTDFIKTGVYDRNREFWNTLSPSMDILVSSNLERLLFELSLHDDSFVRRCMKELTETGTYKVGGIVKNRIQSQFEAGCCNDEQTKQSIKRIWDIYHYLIDPHTAVAFHVLRDYRQRTGDETPCVVASTASPFKFCSAVLDALGVHEHKDGIDILQQLSDLTGVEVPAPLAALKDKQRRFDSVSEKEQMVDCVLEMLK